MPCRVSPANFTGVLTASRGDGVLALPPPTHSPHMLPALAERLRGRRLWAARDCLFAHAVPLATLPRLVEYLSASSVGLEVASSTQRASCSPARLLVCSSSPPRGRPALQYQWLHGARYFLYLLLRIPACLCTSDFLSLGEGGMERMMPMAMAVLAADVHFCRRELGERPARCLVRRRSGGAVVCSLEWMWEGERSLSRPRCYPSPCLIDRQGE